MIGTIAVVALASLVRLVPAAPSPVDVVPVLTSTPFAAAPGRPVSHSVRLSATGGVPAVTVTFTTTVGLDGVTATASRGACPVVTAQKVVCDLGDVNLPGDAPAVTVTGTVHPGTAPGTLVQNLVTVTAADTDPGNNAVSNAYLVAGPSTSPSTAPVGAPARKPASRLPIVVVVLVVLAGGGLLLLRIRHRKR